MQAFEKHEVHRGAKPSHHRAKEVRSERHASADS
jgi:hypothetical protein